MADVLVHLRIAFDFSLLEHMGRGDSKYFASLAHPLTTITQNTRRVANYADSGKVI